MFSNGDSSSTVLGSFVGPGTSISTGRCLKPLLGEGGGGVEVVEVVEAAEVAEVAVGGSWRPLTPLFSFSDRQSAGSG